MRRVLGLVQLLGVAVLVCALLVGAFVAGVFITHPRDEVQFVHYVRKYGDYDGKRARTSATDDQLVAAGDRACDWLRKQKPALWRDDPAHTINGLYPVYRKSSDRDDRKLPEAVVPGAWRELCPAVKVLIEPHRPWERGDD